MVVKNSVRTFGKSDRYRPSPGTTPDFLEVVERFGRTGYWHIDLKTEIVFFSDEVCKTHEMPPGYRPESLKECLEWYHPDDRQTVAEAARLAAADGEPFSYEARLTTVSNAVRWVSVSGEVRFDEEGSPAALIGTMYDISVEREMNRRLGEALREARSASRLKDTFLANMSHELRTPLNAIIGFSQVIKMMEGQGRVDAQVGEYATDIANSGAHLLAIIEDIFSLAQMEAEADIMTFAPIEIGTLLDDVRSLTGTVSREYQRKVVFDAPAGTLSRIVADKSKMTKILVNLVSNAIKFSPPDAPIRVTANMGSCGRAILSVIDKGPGIPDHLQTKIFERFERLEASRHAIEGVGVGLAIARDLVNSMGGEIGVTSVEGEGSTFWLAFDMEAQPQRALAS
jgi:PAS domain S-box-containing protein